MKKINYAYLNYCGYKRIGQLALTPPFFFFFWHRSVASELEKIQKFNCIL